MVYEFRKYWWILVWVNVGLSLLTLPFLLFSTQESPMSFVSIKKFKRARLVFHFIACINRRQMFK